MGIMPVYLHLFSLKWDEIVRARTICKRIFICFRAFFPHKEKRIPAGTAILLNEYTGQGVCCREVAHLLHYMGADRTQDLITTAYKRKG